MQIGHKLQFNCLKCSHTIHFSVLAFDKHQQPIVCSHCEKKYVFDDATILKHLKQFEALCHQIYASRDILGSTNIAVNVGSHEVKIPYKILLTRLSSTIELIIENQKVDIKFRIEPSRDVPEALEALA